MRPPGKKLPPRSYGDSLALALRELERDDIDVNLRITWAMVAASGGGQADRLTYAEVAEAAGLSVEQVAVGLEEMGLPYQPAGLSVKQVDVMRLHEDRP